MKNKLLLKSIKFKLKKVLHSRLPVILHREQSSAQRVGEQLRTGRAELRWT
jgi:hypothetical protein